MSFLARKEPSICVAKKMRINSFSVRTNFFSFQDGQYERDKVSKN